MNIYYSPEHFGLETVATFNFAEPDYSFDMGVVWFSAKEQCYFYDHDMGCSCPSPFEDTDPSDLKPMNFAQVITRINADVKESYNSAYATGQSLQAIETLMRFERNRA